LALTFTIVTEIRNSTATRHFPTQWLDSHVV